jgi:hypothetical protein
MLDLGIIVRYSQNTKTEKKELVKRLTKTYMLKQNQIM